MSETARVLGKRKEGWGLDCGVQGSGIKHQVKSEEDLE
jgi:hypothetical protein